MLYFHRKYEFECEDCGARTYRNQSGGISEIRKRSEKCPACGVTRPDGSSPIKTIVIGERHPDPQSLMEDENQMSKYFCRHLQNARCQQLRENQIQTTTRTSLVTDKADLQILRTLEKILTAAKISYQTAQLTAGNETKNAVYFDTYGVPARMIGSLSALRMQAAEVDVRLVIDGTGVSIERGPDCKDITTSVTEKVNVTMMLPSQGSPDAPSPIEVPDWDGNHTQRVQEEDTLTMLDRMLPSYNARAIMQIKSQNGPIYTEFRLDFGDGKASYRDIENFLGCSKRDIQICRDQVKALMIQLGMAPNMDDEEELVAV